MSFLNIRSIIPPGVVMPFSGDSAPDGWLLCDGMPVSSSDYPELYRAIGKRYGTGDSALGADFNLPDYRWTFLRGAGEQINVLGSGTALNNAATFSNHGIHRSGVRVRFISGTLNGVDLNADYYSIYVDQNTLAFAVTREDAISGFRVALSGENTARLVQWEDPDIGSRLPAHPSSFSAAGSKSGSIQEDQIRSHTHTTVYSYERFNSTGGSNLTGGDGQSSGSNQINPFGGNETRPGNVSVLFIVKT